MQTQFVLDDPESCIGLNLRAATRRGTRRYDAALASARITIGQHSLLGYISRNPGASIGDLGSWLDADRSTIKRNLEPLLTAGLITTRTGTADARRREVRLTGKGRRVMDKADGLWREVQTDTVVAMGERDVKMLFSLLRRLG